MVEHLVVRTPSGRALRVHLGGLEGHLVVALHGTPSSGMLFEPIVQAAAEQDLRLVSYDRPGYGGSDRHEGRSVSDAAGDVLAVADHLGAERFAVWGHSGGGPHAIACAGLLHGRAVACAALSGLAPWDAEGLDWMAGMGEENVKESTLAAQGGEQLAGYLQDERDGMMAASGEDVQEGMSTLLSPVDREALTGDLAAFLTASFHDALGPGIDGWYDDDVAFCRLWGVDLGAIATPLRIYHGTEDRFVPVAHGEWLARAIPQADTRILSGEGHISLYERGARECFRWFAEALAPAHR